MSTMNQRDAITARYYPEKALGGYTRVDGTLEYYSRINALLHADMSVLDFGAGRGAWFKEERIPRYIQHVRLLKGKVARCVGCDVDSAIFENDTVDEKIIISASEKLPFADETFDLISADYVFEHVTNPQFIFSELSRIVRKDGWICARTPNKYGYISLMTRLINNKYHKKILSKAQPERQEIDVFPTAFKANALRDIRQWFPSDQFKSYSYYYESEPSYFFNKVWCFYLMDKLNKVLPNPFKSTLMIFLKKI